MSDPRIEPAAKALYDWLQTGDLGLVWEDWPVEHPMFREAARVVIDAADDALAADYVRRVAVRPPSEGTPAP